MDSSTQDLYYQRLNEFIFDEEKIVTHLSVADELKISSDDAQHLLNSFVKDQKELKKDVIHVTYLLYGMLKDDKGIAVYLVKEESLDDKKCLFSNVLKQNVFSIQKGKQIDFDMIALANSGHENVNHLSTKSCVKRNIKSKKFPEVANISKTNKVAEICKPVSASKSSDVANEDLKKSTQVNGKSSMQSQSSQKNAKGKQGGIASFFAKAPTKSQTAANLEKPNGTEKPTVNLATKTQIPKNLEKPNGTEKNGVNLDEAIGTMDIKEKDSERKVVEQMDVDEEPVKKSQDQTNTKKRKKETKSKAPNKKRKRIQEICDSDSDIFEESENEDIIEKSFEEPPSEPIPIAKPKNKVRKAVDKTYVDEEGFMVTTTEYIYESAPEDEDEPQKENLDKKVVPQRPNGKIAESKPAPKNNKSNKKQTSGKQQTLMSFFKKS